MSSIEPRRSRRVAGLLALGAIVALFAATAAPVEAYKGQGDAVIAAAKHAKGRTLSGQGVKLLAGPGATAQNGKLSLPIAELNPVSQPSAQTAAALTFKQGKRSVALTGIHFNLTKGVLSGQLGGAALDVFWLGAAPQVNPTNGTIALSGGKLQLTAAAADVLEDELGLKRALIRKGVGMIWLAAQASPSHSPAKAVSSGTATWGFLSSWRGYVLFADPPYFGSITLSEGATPSGSLMSPATIWNFPAGSGSFESGLFNGPDRLLLQTGGAVKFSKPGHCIMEIKLANPKVTLDGPSSNLVVDLTYDIDKSTGPGTCEDLGPAVSAPGTVFATLNPSAVTPSWSGDGKTVTWTGVPAALTAAGAVPFGSFYKAGTPLEPITVTAGIG